jgi:N-acetylglutamate synthase
MDLLAALHATWPAAEVRRLGPWTLRRGEGGGSRVSAATLDGPLASPEPAIAAMRAMGQRPLFMVREGEDALDAALAGLGLAVRDPTLVMAGPASEVALHAADLTVIACEGALAVMREIWEAGGVGATRLAVMDRAPQPRCWLLGRLEDRPAGCAFVACQGPVAMLHALQVAPDQRRKGLGSRLTRAAAAWALEQGAETLALAVEAANAPAAALYSGLGMRPAGSYHYRVASAR